MKIENCKLKIKKESFWITKLLLCTAVFSAPLYIIRFHIGPFPTTLLEILILLTTISWLLESRFWTSLPRRKAGQNNGKSFQNRFEKNNSTIQQFNNLFRLLFTVYYLPPLLFLLSAIISTTISPDKHGALGTLKAYIIEPILIYAIVRNIIKTQEDVKKLIATMIASGVFVSLWVILQTAFGWFPRSAGFITSPAEAALGRTHGPYNTANAVGLYLGPIFALTLGEIQNSEIRSKKKLLCYCVIVLLLLTILLSKSTGALIATITIILCFFLLTRYQANNLFHLRFTIYGLLIYCLLFLTFILLIVPHLTPKTSWTTVRPENYTTTTVRFCLWEGTRKMLLDKPIFGAGLSGFKELYAQKYATCDSEPLEYPHNLILNFWAEMGILGVISFLWLVWRAMKKAPIGVKLALIYTLIHGLVDVPYFKNDLALQFWLLLALSSIHIP